MRNKISLVQSNALRIPLADGGFVTGHYRVFQESEARVIIYEVQLPPENWSDQYANITAVITGGPRLIKFRAIIYP